MTTAVTPTIAPPPDWYDILVARWDTMPPLRFAPTGDAWEPCSVGEHVIVEEKGIPDESPSPLAAVLQQWLEAQRVNQLAKKAEK